jgi:uncharacterized radical SAM superfamily protein
VILPITLDEYLKRVEVVNREFMNQLNINSKNPDREDMFKLDSAISCLGVRADNDIFYDVLKISSGTDDKIEKRTGNVGINVIYGQENGLNFRKVAPVEKAYDTKGFTSRSPIEILSESGKFYFAVDGNSMSEINFMDAPKWYSNEVNGVKASSILQNELGNLMGTIPLITKEGAGYQTCIYIENEVPCNFCGLESKKKDLIPTDYAEVVKMALDENSNTTVTLTAGNTPTKNRGIEYYSDFVKAIRKVSDNIPIEVEASPPTKQDSYKIIEELLDAGITSYMSNLEVYDKVARKAALPAKSNIPLEDYMKSFDVANSLYLPTYSVLIVGLEDKSSTIDGVEFLARNGVTTVPLPFKPVQGAEYQFRTPTNPAVFAEVSIQAVEIMRDYGVNPSARSSGGCSQCGGCSVECNRDRNFK